MLKYLSSIFPLSVKIHRMQIPLVDDLKAQKNTIGRFLIKSSVFLVILFLSDQIAGGFLRMGLDRYFGLDVPARILCVGHSHSVLGIDKIALEKELHTPVSKYARQGADASDRLAMIRHYLAVHPNQSG